MKTPADDFLPASETRRETRFLLSFAVGALAFGLICWFFWPHLLPKVKVWLARRHLPAMRQAIDKPDWHAAFTAMRDARRWAPNDPEVLRAGIDLASKANDPRSIIALVTQLQKGGHASDTELALMGQMHVSLGETSRAQAVFDQMPASSLHLKEVQMLKAHLLQADGKTEEAQESIRQALLADDSPESLLQLAQIDLRSPHPGRRVAILERLWSFARSDSNKSLAAIEALAGAPDLTVPQAAELLRLAEAHATPSPLRETARFKALSAQMRVSPHTRQKILQTEISRWTGRKPEEITPLVAWLAEEREHGRILRMMTHEIPARHTDLLPFYVAALRGERKWQDLEQLLTSRIDPTFPAQKIRLWQAEAQSHLDGNPSRAEQTLGRVFEESGRGDRVAETLEAASLAEHLHLWELAQRCYQALAVKHPQTRVSLLPKIYEMAEFQHDSSGMLQACDDLLALRPDSAPLFIQKLYLQMLTGTGIEIACASLRDISPKIASDHPDQVHLLRALAAHRQGMPNELRDAISQIDQPEKLPPGQRVAYAAFLKLSDGDIGRAFRLVEGISPLVLLPEEKAFLKHVL